MFGGDFFITSAFRSVYYNIHFAGGSTTSQHSAGAAIDINYSQLSQTQKYLFAKTASQQGFTGIGVYSTFIHLDIRQNRTFWIAGYDGSEGSSYPVPEDTVEEWRFTLQMHKLDLFRNG